MTYDPRDPAGSLSQHYHDQRRAAARTVVHYCGGGTDARMTLEMLGLFDASLLHAEPSRDLRRDLTAPLPGFLD